VKLLKILSLAALLLLAASSLFAQTNLPDPNDSACWQSLVALHDCVQAQNDRALSQAERCTSYPVYQCEPEAQPNTQEARLQKQKSTGAVAKVNASTNAAQTNVQSDGSGNGSKSSGGTQ
jgi:hypothetical protein